MRTMKFRLAGAAMLAAIALLAADNSGKVMLEAAKKKEVVDGDLNAAIQQYKAIVSKYGKDRPLAAEALVRMAECYQKLGDSESRKIYERIVREFADQKAAVSTAQARLGSSGAGSPGSLTSRVVCRDCGDYETFLNAEKNSIAYTDYATGDVVIRDLATGQEKRLLNRSGYRDSTEYPEEPVLSRDLQQVTYIWQTGSGGSGRPTQLRVTANQTGGKTRVLLDNSSLKIFSDPLSWSPDGKSILLLIGKSDRTMQLAWIPAEGGALKVIKDLQWRLAQKGGIDPKLSPDGKYVAYHARAVNPTQLPPPPKDASDRHIYVIAADGSSEAEVVKTAGGNSSPVWTPDGKHLLFLSNRSGDSALWSVPVSNGKAAGDPSRVMPDFGGGYWGAGWVYPLGVTTAGSYYYILDRGEAEQIHLGNLQPGKAGAQETFAALRPVWSPDGKSVAFYRHQYGDDSALDLVVHSLSSGEERAYKTPLGYNSAVMPVWSHDSRTILTRVAQPGGAYAGTYRVDVASGEYKQVLSADHPVGLSALSPDDKTLYTLRPQSGVIAIDLASGKERVVYALSGDSRSSFALSPDGLTVALWRTDLQTRKTSLSAIDVGSGSLRELAALDFTAYDRPSIPAWTKDGRSILFAERHGNDSQVMRISAQGVTPEAIGIPAVRDWEDSLDVSPDGTRIAYSTGGNEILELRAIDNILAALK